MSERDDAPIPKNFNIQPKIVVLVVLAIVVIALLLSSFFVVDQTERSVVLRFGRVNRIVGPGLQFKVPLGIEKNMNVPTQVVQTMDFGFRTQQAGVTSTRASGDYTNESLMLTGDLNIIDVEWTVQYRIDDPIAWLFNVEDKEKTIRDISQSVLNAIVGDLPILSVMAAARSEMEIDAQERMQTLFRNYGLGIRVVTVKLKNIVPPVGRVQDAFEDVNKAIQDMNRLINEGKQAYNAEIPKAEGEAEQQIQIAEGYASERVNEAIGDAARFDSVLRAYRVSKDVTAKRLYIEAMEDILAGGNITLIDRTLENFLPLQNLQPQTPGGLE
ncbi:MAG: FtsH protease activity modulator HflK [Spirochaetota bacterium]